MEPYDAGGDPNHPGVAGKPFQQPQVPGVNVPLEENQGSVDKVDSTGTGTFPPDQQGTENRAQPAGLSSSTQYGEPSGTTPVQNVIPKEQEGQGYGKLTPVEEEPSDEVDSEESSS